MAKVLEFQLQHQSLKWIFRTDFFQDWLVRSPCSPRDSQESSPTPQFKSINSFPGLCSAFFIVQLLHPYVTTGKTIALTRQTFVSKIMSLLLNMLSRLVIAFLPRPTCQCKRCKRHGFSPWVRKIPWKRARQPTPVFLPGESHGQRILVGYGP